jgi:CRP-like cAMP-binding protein
LNTDQTSLLKLLSATRFVEGISSDHLQRLCRASRLLNLPAGTKLFQEGSIEDEVFVISSGHIRLSMNVPGRGEVPFLTTGPGELVGWSGLIGDGCMTATATAIDDTILIAMSGKKLLELCDSEKELGSVLFQRVAQVLSQRLLSTRLQLMDLFAGERTHS